ncbi:unnamed protein product [Lasius platythorax]|uniref:Transposase n=1 Tax=Lasius platythorax TaxID=488582 RepID=A0AAV2N6R7_9HYME
MKLYQFLSICDDRDKLIDYLIEHRVLPSSVRCPRCDNAMDLNRNSLFFRCYKVEYIRDCHKKKLKKKCDKKLSIFHNTWFAESRLDLQTVCRFVAYFLHIRPPRYTFLERELEISDRTIVNWSGFCRELCIQWMKSHSEMIGGEGQIVEIDEAKMGKRKYNKGHMQTRANISKDGTQKYHFVGYSAEFFFRRHYNHCEIIDAFFNIMANMYPISE